jgi:hypothetical protein
MGRRNTWTDPPVAHLTAHIISTERAEVGWYATCTCGRYRSRPYLYSEDHAHRAGRAHLGAMGVEPGDPVASLHQQVQDAVKVLLIAARGHSLAVVSAGLIRHCEVDLRRLALHWPMRDRVTVWCHHDAQPWPCEEFRHIAAAAGVPLPASDQPADDTDAYAPARAESRPAFTILFGRWPFGFPVPVAASSTAPVAGTAKRTSRRANVARAEA